MNADLDRLGMREVTALPLLMFEMVELQKIPFNEAGVRQGAIELEEGMKLTFQICIDEEGRLMTVGLEYVKEEQGSEEQIASLYTILEDGKWNIFDRETKTGYRDRKIFKALYGIWEKILTEDGKSVEVELEAGQLDVLKAFERLGFTGDISSSEVEGRIASGGLYEELDPKDLGSSVYLKLREPDELGRQNFRFKLRKTLKG